MVESVENPNQGFPLFPPRLEIRQKAPDSHIPTAPTPTINSSDTTFKILPQVEGGAKVGDICRKVGISELRELRLLREENGRLKRLVADLSLDRQILQEIVSKKL